MPLKLCLVGAGHMGRLHAGKLAGMKDVSLTCVVDVNRPQADEVAGGHGTRGSDRIEDALADGVQGVVIASTTGTHFAIAREFLKRGVHVFVEKPIAADPEEAEALIELAREERPSADWAHRALLAGFPAGLPIHPRSSLDGGAQDWRLHWQIDGH